MRFSTSSSGAPAAPPVPGCAVTFLTFLAHLIAVSITRAIDFAVKPRRFTQWLRSKRNADTVGGSAHALVWSLQCISSAPPRGAPGECAIPDWRRTVDRLVLHRLRLHRPFEGKGNGKALCPAKSQRPGLLFVQFGINRSIQGSERCEIAVQKAHCCDSDVDSCSSGRRALQVLIHSTQPLNHAWIEGLGAPAGPGRELV